jgi:hypothetical protein
LDRGGIYCDSREEDVDCNREVFPSCAYPSSFSTINSINAGTCYLLEINIRSADHVVAEGSDSKENEEAEDTAPFNPSVQEHESVPSTDTAPSSPVESYIPLPPIPIPPLLEPLSQSLVNEISTIISQTENISNIDFISQLALSNDEMAYNLSMFSLYSALNNN